jgi:hypothetical protein
MESAYRRFSRAFLPTLAFLVLLAGLTAFGATAAHAATSTGGAAQLGRTTIDGQPTPPDTCVRGDSWCAFCTAMPSVTACKAFPPAQAAGTTSRDGISNSGNRLIPGVDTGGNAPLPNLPAGFTGAMP